MANPPVNRRPGVDASIVQADWVRGYDGPQVTDDPCDIILSNGANEVDGRVSNLFIWNRTPDRAQPMFIFAVGADFTTPDSTFGVYAGPLSDPNGIITDSIGALYLSNAPAGLWQNQDGVDTWKKISDDLGGENLEETLAIGNFTGDQALIISDGALARIIGEENTTGGAGAPVKIYGGTASGVTGDGGDVWITSGVTTGGNTGEVRIASADILAGTGNVGPVRLFGGNTTGGGDGGDISATAGNGAQGGEVLLQGGDGANVGGDRGGRVLLYGGNSPADGDGGSINFAAGSPGTPIAWSNLFNAGQGGWINFAAGNSASAETGGVIFLKGGKGGSANGPGGNIVLEGGDGGGAADDGKIEARGIFFGENYLRDDGDPNVLGKIAPEGSIFQRSTAGFGQAWVNVNGTSTGWSQLLGAGGGIVSALTQIQWGSLTAGTDNTNDNMDTQGVLHDSSGNRIVYQETTAGGIAQGQDGTPTRFFGVNAVLGTASGVYVDTFIDRAAHFRATWKIVLPSVVDGQRIFCGFTRAVGGNTVTTQLATNNPGDSWFGIWKKAGETNFRFQAQSVGNDAPLSSVAVVASQVYYFAFDCFLDADGGVTAYILDDQYNILDQHTFDPQNSVFGSGTDMRLMAGTGTDGVQGNNFQLFQIAVVTRTDLAAAAFAGGMAGFAPPLSQVLLAGNETGASDIVVDHNRGVFGKIDDNGFLGGSLSIGSGRSTNAAGSSGALSLFSQNATVGVLTGGTGDVLLASGVISGIAASGATGQVLIRSGASGGASGETGDVDIQSGAFTGGGALATTGDINIEVGGGAASDANPGLLALQGGRTSLNGVTGGNIEITSGENTVNGASGQITLFTANSAVDGNSGDLRLFTGFAGTNSGNSGSMYLLVGSTRAAGAVAGDVQIGAGSSGFGLGADAGDVFISSGTSELAQGGNIEFATGGSTIGGFRGGDFIFNPGSGPAGDGEVIINGKLTVTGLIDPTGLVLTGQALVPTVVNPGDGLLWVDNTGANTILNYTDDANVTIQLGAGGGGGDTFEDVLSAGNATGNQPILITDADQAGIIGQDSAVTDGGNIFVVAGSSLVGGGGIGGRFQVTTGDADPSGNGAGGLLRLKTSEGAGTGDGGLFDISTGDGGATSGAGGSMLTTLGAGGGTGDGGSFSLFTGDGGAGGGNGGEIRLKPGAGAGGGVAGVVELDGDVRIAGDLQVDGVIDPLGIGFVAQGANPIPLPGGGTPLAGSVWTNFAGELIFTNGGGDLNISTAIATGVGSLAATLAVGSTTGVNGIEFSLGSPGISGADNAGGSGGNVAMVAGSSTGGGGSGGSYSILSGSPDTNGSGGSFLVALAPGDGTGNGGSYVVTMGNGGATSGNGGSWGITMGDGGGTGAGGGAKISSGEGGGGGGNAGNLEFALGSANAGSGGGGGFLVTSGGSFGPTVGGGISLAAGAGGGGAGAGDGGIVLLQGGNQVGVGDYGGVRIRAGGATTETISSGDIELVSAPSATGTESAFFLLTGGSAGKPGVIVGNGGNGALGTNSIGGGVTFGAGSGDGSGDGGVAELVAGSTGTGTGGKGSFKAGNAGAGNGSGGLIEIIAGTGLGTGLGGNVLVQSGAGSGFAEKGSIHLLAEGGTPVGLPGSVEGVAASPPAIGTGGSFHLTAAGGIAAGGARLIAGDGLLGAGVIGGAARIEGGVGVLGGPVAVAGGDAEVGSGGIGGQVAIHAGKGDAPGAPGQITLGNALNGDTLNLDSPAMKMGTFALPPGALPPAFPVTFAAATQGPGGAFLTPFTAPPRVLILSYEGSPGQVVTVTPGSITPLGFTLDTTVVIGGADLLHFTAYL